MMALDIANLSESDLRNLVASHCSEFGTVHAVNVFLPNDQSEYAVVVVNMATPTEAAAVHHKFGNAKVGSTALIRLEQEVKEAARECKGSGTTTSGKVSIGSSSKLPVQRSLVPTA